MAPKPSKKAAPASEKLEPKKRSERKEKPSRTSSSSSAPVQPDSLPIPEEVPPTDVPADLQGVLRRGGTLSIAAEPLFMKTIGPEFRQKRRHYKCRCLDEPKCREEDTLPEDVYRKRPELPDEWWAQKPLQPLGDPLFADMEGINVCIFFLTPSLP